MPETLGFVDDENHLYEGIKAVWAWRWLIVIVRHVCSFKKASVYIAWDFDGTDVFVFQDFILSYNTWEKLDGWIATGQFSWPFWWK